MPTILRLEGLRIVIYPNDHRPEHVHVIGSDWEVVIELLALDIRESTGCAEYEARRALRLVSEHRAALLQAWRRVHG